MTQYRIALYYEDELITGVDSFLFQTKEEAGMYGLGCVCAYRFIERIIEQKNGDNGEYLPDPDADLSFEVIPVEMQSAPAKGW